MQACRVSRPSLAFPLTENIIEKDNEKRKQELISKETVMMRNASKGQRSRRLSFFENIYSCKF